MNNISNNCNIDQISQLNAKLDGLIEKQSETLDRVSNLESEIEKKDYIIKNLIADAVERKELCAKMDQTAGLAGAAHVQVFNLLMQTRNRLEDAIKCFRIDLEDTIERLECIEHHTYPSLGKTLRQLRSVVGNADWNLLNPFDRQRVRK